MHNDGGQKSLEAEELIVGAVGNDDVMDAVLDPRGYRGIQLDEETARGLGIDEFEQIAIEASSERLKTLYGEVQMIVGVVGRARTCFQLGRAFFEVVLEEGG